MPVLLKSVLQSTQRAQSRRKSRNGRFLSFFLCALCVLCEKLFYFRKCLLYQYYGTEYIRTAEFTDLIGNERKHGKYIRRMHLIR